MCKLIYKINLLLIFFVFSITILRAEIINGFNVEGNQRISSETIKMFAGVDINDDVSQSDLNNILKRLYDTNFFDLVSVKMNNKTLIINVKENPIIQNINYKGIKSSKILDDLKNVELKSRSSLMKFCLKEIKKIKNFLKNIGYYFSELKILIEELEDNKINLTYEIFLDRKPKFVKFHLLEIKYLKIKN